MKYKSNNFRTVTILEEETNLWKKYFLKLITDEFYQKHKVFKLDENNKPKIALCFDWVIGNVDIGLNKGLLLRGDVGTGKSAIMKACRKLCEKLYTGIYTRYATADEISRLFKDSSEDSDRKLNNLLTARILFIDDIGYEALKVFDHYPIMEVIRDRYDKKRITCITTNMSMEEMAERYNKSFEDKISEMCFIIKFEGNSKR
jgi:DNA replication protein DnaC